jgi:hypothetical protein
VFNWILLQDLWYTFGSNVVIKGVLCVLLTVLRCFFVLAAGKAGERGGEQ